MKLGLLEITLIIIIITLVLVAVRVVGAGRNTAYKVKNTSLEIPQRQVEQSVGNGLRLRRAGVAFIVIAIILVLSAMSMFKWVMKGFTWSFIALAIGFAILFMSRKR